VSILPLVLLLGWYWASPGVVRNLDWHVHVCWISGYADALGHGLPYPRWIDTPNAGLGAPVFLLYPPLGHFLGALAASIGGATAGLKFVVSLATILQFLGARSWFSLHTSGGNAGLLAAAFCVAPQAVAPGYWFNMPATALGLACVAWVLALLDPRRDTSPRQAAGLALACGALLLAHLPTAITALPVAAALWLASLRQRPAAAAARIGAAFVGLLLASPYLLAAWLSRDLLHTDFLRENPLWRIDHNLWPLVGDATTRALAANAAWFRLAALLTMALASIALLALWRRHALDAGTALLAAATLLCCALMFTLSAPVYQGLPFLQWLQFGWRWQGVCLLGTLGLVARALGGSRLRTAPAIVLPVLGLLATLTLLGPDAHAPFWKRSRTSALEADTAAARCGWDTLEHRPRSMGDAWQMDSRLLPQSVQVLDGRTHVQQATRAPHHRQYRLHVDFPGRLRLDALAFPGWTAELDGQPVAVDSGTGGLFELDLPAGSHHLHLRYRAPMAVRVAEGISLALLLALIGLLLRGRPLQR
jgi:hypothetical protein